MRELVEIGSLGKSHGVKGEIKLRVEDAYIDDLFETELIFVQTAQGEVPFFIDELKEGSNLLLKLDGVNNPEQAKELTGAKVFMDKKDISKGASAEALDSGLDFGFLSGFMLIDQNEDKIGIIDDIIAFPQQELASVEVDGQDVLIPLHENLFIKIDAESKQLFMEIAEGLLPGTSAIE